MLDLTLRQFEVMFTCDGRPGARKVWAPSERSAARVLQTRPGRFGIDTGEDDAPVIVGRVRDLRPARAAAA
jgi:hypothetical protein